MKFLVDQNLPVVLAEWLAAAGHQADHVRLLGLAEADDLAIARLAISSGAIVITRDGDFRRLAAPPPGGPQVVWVRFGNTTNPYLLQAWSVLWPAVEAALRQGEGLVEVV